MQKIILELKLTSTGFLEFIVLKMISGQMTYSAEEIFDELKKIGFKTPMGSIYPLLSAFRRKGYVSTGYEEGDAGSVIKTYHTNKKGDERLIQLRRDWKQLNQLVARLG